MDSIRQDAPALQRRLSISVQRGELSEKRALSAARWVDTGVRTEGFASPSSAVCLGFFLPCFSARYHSSLLYVCLSLRCYRSSCAEEKREKEGEKKDPQATVSYLDTATNGPSRMQPLPATWLMIVTNTKVDVFSYLLSLRLTLPVV